MSDIPENTEVTGTLAPNVIPNDVMSLAHAIETMLELSDAERNAMGEKLRERILVKHDWNEIAKTTLELYRELKQEPLECAVPVTAP